MKTPSVWPTKPMAARIVPGYVDLFIGDGHKRHTEEGAREYLEELAACLGATVMWPEDAQCAAE